MAVEQRIIIGSIDHQRVYQSFVKPGDCNQFVGVKKEDKKHPLVGRIYRLRIKTNAELNAEFGRNLAPGEAEEQDPFLVQVVAANGKVILKELRPVINTDLMKDNVTALYEMYLEDVRGDTNPFYNITDVTDMAVPLRLEETTADYLIRLKQFGRRPEGGVIRSVLKAATRMDYLTATPMSMV